jgi:hypothetical protein
MYYRTTFAALMVAVALIIAVPAFAGVTTVNGWYEGEEIYYIDGGVEEGVTERGRNQIYIIGSVPRLYQANVVLHIPGEPGYSPHWNVNFVHTAEGVTVQDIIDAELASPLFFAPDENGENLGTLFDDVVDILTAEAMDLVDIESPGVVVLCPIISEMGAEAPGNNEAPEDEFDLLDTGDTF